MCLERWQRTVYMCIRPEPTITVAVKVNLGSETDRFGGR